MKIFDQHVHTELSVDSKEKINNYLKKCDEMGIEYFVSTEHLDLENGLLQRDVIPDFHKQRAIIGEYKNKYKTRILMGIEVGYKTSIRERNIQILEENEFDVVLLSAHEDEEIDVNTEQFYKGRSPEEIYNEYLDLCINAVTEFDNFDIFTHVDYLLRYIDRVDISIFEEKLMSLLGIIIKKNKTLEFNTRHLYAYQDASYNQFIFQTYYDMGGRNISLGSDAHVVDFFFGEFDWAKEILRGIGFREVTLFINREPIKACL